MDIRISHEGTIGVELPTYAAMLYEPAARALNAHARSYRGESS